MGRAKTKAKQKSNVPIPFPHDGPVFRSNERECSPGDGHAQSSIGEAVKILNDTKDTSSRGGDSKTTGLIYNLCHNLQRTNTTTKEQLQALQSFKCSYLNLAKDNRSSDTIGSHEETDSILLIGLYRLLLEWSLSCETPLPFQRAIQAILKVFGSCMTDNAVAICKDVMESIWKEPESWKDPLHAFDVSVNYTPLREILQKDDLLPDSLAFLGRSKTVTAVLEKGQGSSLSSQLIDSSILIVTMLKTLLGGVGANIGNILTSLEVFENFVFALLTCANLPSDGFNTLGILYGKLLCLRIDIGGDARAAMIELCKSTVAALDSSTPKYEKLSPLARLSMVQGIAATLDANVLMTEESNSPLEVCWEYSLRIGQTSTDPLVRWASIKGLSTLASRWKQHQSKTEEDPIEDQQEQFQHRELIEKTVDLVFDSWENPPLRKLGTAIPGLFKALVQLLPLSELQRLCEQVWKQPASRKGRYLALEILLPYMPTASTQKDESAPSSSSSAVTIPMESLLEGIGDRGSNAGSIANLWIKVLKRAWEELSSENGDPKEFNIKPFESWKNYWMPSFCRTVLDPSLTRRKQVMAFCIPRIADLMKEYKTLRDHLHLVFIGLLEGIEAFSKESAEVQSLEDTFSDRILWAELEITRYSSVMKVSGGGLNEMISSCLHKKKFQYALVHALPFIRIIAFQAMDCVVSSYGVTNNLQEEAAMWRFALPYSNKTNESKEYLSNLLQCLSNFLDRLSGWEAGSNEDSEKGSLPIFHSFAVDFLIDDVVLDKGAYSGTICDKELFGVSLLDCLLSFALQDESFRGDNTTMKKNAVFNRKRLSAEDNAMNKVLQALVRPEVLSSLFALLHSIWDNTRGVTFKFLTKLIIACQSRNVALAKEYSDENQRKYILTRGIYLASSPRQRESDTGARMLTFLYASTQGRAEKDLFLEQIVNLSMTRVSSMKQTLNDVLSGNSSLADGSCLPLAHGLVHATRLCIEDDETARRLLSSTSNVTNVGLNESMIEVFCKALQLSLSVVADVRDGEAIDGIDEEAVFAAKSAQESDSTPLNVNTGAIGANGTFSSVSETNMEEEKARLAMQRVVVGSWLLTKETCAAIASVITIEGYGANYTVVSKVGQLLLSTLTTLKHAGAAFAARDALQIIAINCLKPNTPSDTRSLPGTWSRRLVDEISLNEKVRNSTLRRSTGYALGFLAVMRADVGNKSDSSVISTPLLHQLLKLSLPPKQRVKESLAKLKLSENQGDTNKMFVFASGRDCNQPYLLDDQYQARCRVHALNVLRMIILDAPLASVISPLVGDAIISAILGYDDPSWAIRNSSTMVFAAAMLRVIDSDKNASNNDKTSSNAITLTELFRRYPPLVSFIPSVLRLCLEDMERMGIVKSEMFPILLMLSRVQPVVDSSTKISDNFIPLLFRCLGSKDHGIRHAAARSLANLTTNATASALLSDCKQHLIEQISGNNTPDWNLFDGILLAMDALDLSSNEQLLDIESQSNLFTIASSVRIPPSCRSTALAILLASPFVQRDELVHSCETVSRSHSIRLMIGGSLLYKTASEGLCLISQESVWHAESELTLQHALSQLKTIFTSGIVDVRLHAVKFFKKGIYDNLDHLYGQKKKGRVGLLAPEIVSNRLATMLLQCVADELGRGITENTGSHIPTLRRLTRCFLETVDATPRTLLYLEKKELIWSIAFEITEREYSFLTYGEHTTGSVNYLESDGGNVLSSNAVEMMAVFISLAKEEMEVKQTYDRMKILLRVVDSLNDPSGSWRSRYSATLALEKCCHTISESLSFADNADEEHLRKKAQRTVLEMLQDSDPDVRTVAVRIASKFYSTAGEHNGSASTSHLLLPEWTLVQTFPSTFAVNASSSDRKVQLCSTMKILLALILDHCHNINDIIGNVQDEFCHTIEYDNEDADSLKRLVNVNSMRKIFEDEDPNPFQEKILLNQLATQSILNLRNGDPSDSNLDFPPAANTVDVLAICDSVLAQLLETQSEGGMIHELSRFPTIFPSMHSILCASAASLYMLERLSNESEPSNLFMLRKNIQTSAQKIASTENNSKCLHPEIHCAVLLLSKPQRIKGEDVEDLLFLLKAH